MTEPPVVKSARETAYDYLKAAIVSGELEPGQIVDDETIAKLCGTSRTPVREAIIQLEKVGLVYAPPRRRPSVAPSRGDDVEQILAPLGALQALAARLATPLVTAADVALMEELNSALVAAADASDWGAAAVTDMKFHFVLVNRTNNRFLINEVDNLQTLFTRANRLYMRNRGPDQQSGQEHASIIDAVKNGDAAAAAGATTKNFQRLPIDDPSLPPRH